MSCLLERLKLPTTLQVMLAAFSKLEYIAGILKDHHKLQPSVSVCTNLLLISKTFPLQARDKQLARLQREEKLGALQVELGNKKTLRLTQLRSFARVVGGLRDIFLFMSIGPIWMQAVQT